MTRASTRRSRCRRTPCGPRSRAGSPPRPRAPAPTSAVPAPRRGLRRDAVPRAVRAARARGHRPRYLGQPARSPAGADRGRSRRRRVVRRRPLCAGARARRRSGPRRRGARARDAPRRPRAPVDPRDDGLPPEPRRPLALDGAGSGAAVLRERPMGFGYGVRRLRHGLVSRDAERDLPRARSPPHAAARRARAAGRIAESRRAGARSPGRRAARRGPGTLAANYHVVAERAA